MRSQSSRSDTSGQATTSPDDSDPPRTYHGELALLHFAQRLTGQPLLLLAYLWACVPDPWVERPSLFVSGSRIAHFIADSSNRCKAYNKLERLGALKRGKRSRRGLEFVLLRPTIDELDEDLRHAIAKMSPRDYRFDPCLPKPVRASKPRPKFKRTKLISRKKITEYMQEKGLSWPKLAQILTAMCGLNDKGKPQSFNHGKGGKEVEAFGSWLVMHGVKVVERQRLVNALIVPHDLKPSGNELRYVFESNTPAKAAYLAWVLSEFRKVQDNE